MIKDRRTLHPLYFKWRDMHSRCYRSNSISYKYYGARGITVCDRWKDFWNFVADMGEQPPGTWIDRIDNDGNYEPSNCRWATPTEQQVNSSKARVLRFGNDALSMSDWDRKLGLSRGSVSFRLRTGWSVEQALTTPKQAARRQL